MNQYERLEELMIEYEFTDLSQSDRTWVGQYLSASDYASQRLTLLTAKTQLAQVPLVPKHLEGKLMNAFRTHHAIPVPLSTRMINPLLWSAATIAIFLLGRWSTPTTSNNPPEIQTTIVYETVKDTVYVDRVKVVPNTILKEVIVTDTVYIQAIIAPPIATNIPEIMSILEISPLQTRSSNAKEDQQLYDILVDVY